MKKLGLGITNQDISGIPVYINNTNGYDSDGDSLSDDLEKALGTDINNIDTDGDGFRDDEEIKNGYNPLGTGRWVTNRALIDRLRGRILLQVESKGEAWYVNPVNGKRYFLGKPSDAFEIMKKLGLGITNQDLSLIDEAGAGNQTNLKTDLIVGNYDQLVLNENDVQSKFWFMMLDKENSKEIKNLSELDLFDLGILTKQKYNFLGGYVNRFIVNTDAVLNKIEKGEIGNENPTSLNSISSKVVALSSSEEAKDYINKTKEALYKNITKLNNQENTKPENIITEFDVGEDGFKISLIGKFVAFRINNVVNALMFLGQPEYITEKNILELSKVQAMKFNNYKTPTKKAVQNFSLDSDGDGLNDYLEVRYGTDINNPDTDGDGYMDGIEVDNCYSPTGPNKVIDENIVNKLTNKEYLKSLDIYIPNQNEDVLETLTTQEFTRYEIISPKEIKTGINAKDNKRYFILSEGDFGPTKQAIFNNAMELVEICKQYGFYPDGKPAICLELEDANNFEPDCSVDFVLK